MRALVVGGTGFLGRHLCRRLVDAGHDVVAAARRHQACAWLVVVGDISDADFAWSMMKDCDWVFHLAAAASPPAANREPALDARSNLAAWFTVLETCRRVGRCKLIFASSGGTVYGPTSQTPIPEEHPTQPACAYGTTKLAMEKYLHVYHHLHGLDHAVLRIANAYGEGQNPLGEQGVVAVFLRLMAQGSPLTVYGDGRTVRDYVHVGDVADALIAAAEQTTSTRVFNVGSGTGVDLGTLVGYLSNVTGIVPTLRHLPARPLDVPRVVLDIRKAAAELNWRPTTPLLEGLARTWQWLQNTAATTSLGAWPRGTAPRAA